MKFKITAMATIDISYHYMVEPQVAGLQPCKISISMNFLVFQNKSDIEQLLKERIVEQYQSLVNITVDTIELEEAWICPQGLPNLGEVEERCPHCGKVI